MPLAVFEKFLHDLHIELDKLEFQHYDLENTVCRVSTHSGSRLDPGLHWSPRRT